MPDRPPVTFEVPALERRIATALHKLGLAMKHQAWIVANQAGLSPTQGHILTTLVAAGPLTASELAERLGLTLPTVSEAVSTLVAKRLLRRTADPRHPRARLLRLTRTGTQLAHESRTWPEFLASAVAHLTEQEQTTLLNALLKMIHALQEAGQIPTSQMCTTCVYFQPYVHDGPRPHHCAFVDVPMAARDLRVECPDHATAPPEQRHISWARLVAAP